MNMRFRPSFLPRLLAGFLLSALAGAGIAQTAAKAKPSTIPVAPVPQITQAINESNLIALKGTVSSLIASAQDQGAAPCNNRPVGTNSTEDRMSAIRGAFTKK